MSTSRSGVLAGLSSWARVDKLARQERRRVGTEARRIILCLMGLLPGWFLSQSERCTRYGLKIKISTDLD